MKTLPPLVIEQASNGGGTHVAFRITHQDEKLIPRGTFYERGGDEGGFRSYLKKNIVGGKIVEL